MDYSDKEWFAFLEQWLDDQANTKYYFLKYGEERVKQWLHDADFWQAYIELEKQRARDQRLHTERVANLKRKALENMTKLQNGEKVDAAIIRNAEWILIAEHEYEAARGHLLGERSVTDNKPGQQRKFKFIRGGNSSSESSV